MNLSTQPYKGARDFYPEDKRLQKYIFSMLRHVVEGFGYQEYDAPIIEPIELYLSKTSEEIVNQQTYNFVDRGGRNVTLRPEMTPTVSRMVAARRQELAYPLRLYSIPNLWRYERPQAGRLREHWQLNVDLFGINGIEADHELVLVADRILKSFGAKSNMYEIRLNSRLLVNWLLLEYLQLDHASAVALIRLIDNIHKLPSGQFKEFAKAMLSSNPQHEELTNSLMQILTVKKFEDLPLVAQQHPDIEKLKKLMGLLDIAGVDNAVFDITLMRGFDYYTDVVFEVFDKHPDNNRSMFGGGRYDGLVAQFGVEPVPTVGFGMGDVTLQRFLEGHNLLPKLRPETDVVAILIGDIYDRAQKVFAELRKEGVRLAVDSTGRKLDSQIKNAAKSGCKFVLFIGEEELANGQYKLKNLETGHEEVHGIDRIISILAGQHKSNSIED